MRINYRYESKDYPGFPKLSKKSKTIGLLTCGAWVVLIYSWFWLAFLAYLMEVFDISPSNIISILAFASLLIPYFLLKKLRKHAFAKLDKTYIDQVNALRYSDPAKFNAIVMELQKRQNGR